MSKSINRWKGIIFVWSVIFCTSACAAPAAGADTRPYDIQADVQKSITVKTISAQPYIKGGVRPFPQVKDGEKELICGKDYVINYYHNDEISYGGKTAAVAITGTGDYTGTLTVPFDVTAGSLSDNNIMIMMGDIAFQNENNICSPVFWVIDHGYLLEEGLDYEETVKYTYKNATLVCTGAADASKTIERSAGEEVREEDIIPAGTVLVAAVTGRGAYVDSFREAEFCVVSGTDISKADAEVKPQAYTGHAITLTPEDITVKVDGKELAADGSAYEIVGYVDRIQKGTAKVLLKGCGAYAGTKEAEFKIV